jgi:DNA replication protein DnaC
MRTENLKRHNSKVAEIEQKVPRIATLRNKLNTVSREIALVSFGGYSEEEFSAKVQEIKSANLATQQEISRLLVENGFQEDDLKLKYHCPMCRDTGFKKDENGLELNQYCDCLLDIVKKFSSQQISIKCNLDSYRFDNFNVCSPTLSDIEPCLKNGNKTIREHMIEVVQNCENYARDFKIYHDDPSQNPDSILIYGRTGLGKTHISLAIAGKVLSKNFNVVYTSALELFKKLSDEEFKLSTHETLDTVLETDLLIIDDLGTEMDNKFYTSMLYNIINSRFMNDRLPIIISTNLSLSELESKYNERILSRILSYRQMEFFGKDFRNSAHKADELHRKTFL